MKLKILALHLLLIPASLSHGQKPHPYRGSLVYKLGPDTASIGNFDLLDKEFKLTVVSMSPGINVSKLKGTFFANGELKYVQGNNYDPTKGKDSLNYSYSLNYDRDSTFIETKRGNRSRTRKYPVKIMVANNLGGDAIVFMLALLADFAPATVNDSLISHHIVFNSARKFIIKRTGNNKLVLGSSVMGMFTVYLNREGKIKSVDAMGTSFNIKGTAGPFLNIDSVITSNVNHHQSSPRLGIINKLDSIKAIVNGTAIKIVYSRPSVRKRVIFGEVVPWNKVWRTGAEAATKLTISGPLYFKGKELPAGNYSIFTLPGPDSWTLVFNKQADIWGTEYNASYDALRIPMTRQFLDHPLELLTLSMDSTGSSGGNFSISWDKVKANVDFTTKP